VGYNESARLVSTISEAIEINTNLWKYGRTMLRKRSGSASDRYEENVRNHLASGSFVKESMNGEIKDIIASIGVYCRIIEMLVIRELRISNSVSYFSTI